jgi:tetratricopeptide (TPR) repeat protein
MAVDSGARPTNTLTGDLASRPLAMLLAGACERKTSGTFTFRHDRRSAIVTLRDGQIAVVRTSEPLAYLGGILYESGAIDMETLNATLLVVARDKRLHGEILLERGALSRDRLDEALVEQTFRKVHHVFSFPEETIWTFRDDVDDLAGARDEPRPPVETWRAIWRGLREHPMGSHARALLAKVQGGIHLKDLEFVERFGLAPEELALCEQLHAQPSTLAQLVATSRLVPERTGLLVYLLALSRCIVRIEPAPKRPVELGVDGVRERAQRIDGEDAYTTLGLRAGSSREAARAAYFRLARLWHPEKIPAELDEVRAECAHVFRRLGEAHRSLTDLTANLRIEDMIGSGDLAANDSVAPLALPAPTRSTLHDADAALARGEVAEAEAIALALSCGGSEGPGARAILAWCSIGAGATTDQQALERALTALEKVLTGDPDCVRALYFRGQLLKRFDRLDAAARDFKKAARLDPRHVDAQREVRLHELRRRKSSAEHAATAPPGPSARSGERAPGSEHHDDPPRTGLRRLLARVVRDGS